VSRFNLFSSIWILPGYSFSSSSFLLLHLHLQRTHLPTPPSPSSTMSATSKRKVTQFRGPLLPGSKAWDKHQAQLRWEREQIDKQKHVVDDHPVPIDIRYEINFHQLRQKEQKQMTRELDNRYLVNKISYVMQNRSETQHVLSRPLFAGSPYKQKATQALYKRLKENFKCALDFERCYSDYDHVQMAFEWTANRKKKYNISRYKEDLWKPVFEKQKRSQALRGRSLDPFYTFKFD